MMKKNKLLSKAGFYYYNLLAFITNGNKRFVDKKLIFGALLIGFGSQYGCKTKNEEAQSDLNSIKNTENKKDTTLKEKITKLYLNNDSTLKRDINGIEINYTPTCYLISKESQKKPSPQIVIERDNKIIEDFNSEPSCYVAFETWSEYPGGEEKRIKFIKENLKYPKTAIDNNIQGTVYVTFTVEKDGSISNIEILRGIYKECDEEAIRVVKLMPKWIPGEQKGKAVKVQMNMPIKFKLEDEKK